MKQSVEKLADQVRALPAEELDELLTWLAASGAEQHDAWDAELAADSAPGGRLQPLLAKVRADLAAGRTRPLR